MEKFDSTRDKRMLFPLCPIPNEGESLSSWVRRLAETYGFTLKCLVTHLDSSLYGQCADIDRNPPELLIQELYRAVAIKPDYIKEKMLLNCFEDRVFPRLDTKTSPFWIRPLSHQRICPLCYKEKRGDMLVWRLGFVTMCPHHKIHLVALHDAKITEMDELSQKNQLFLLNQCQKSQLELGKYGLQPAYIWFRVLLMGCQLSLHYELGEKVCAWVAQESGPKMQNINIPIKSRSTDRVALLTIDELNYIVNVAIWLMDDYPKNFVGLNRSRIIANKDFYKKWSKAKPQILIDTYENDFRMQKPALSKDEFNLYAEINGANPYDNKRQELRQLLGRSRADRFIQPLASRAQFGEGLYWKLSGVNPEIRATLRFIAQQEQIPLRALVEQILNFSIKENLIQKCINASLN